MSKSSWSKNLKFNSNNKENYALIKRTRKVAVSNKITRIIWTNNFFKVCLWRQFKMKWLILRGKEVTVGHWMEVTHTHIHCVCVRKCWTVDSRWLCVRWESGHARAHIFRRRGAEQTQHWLKWWTSFFTEGRVGSKKLFLRV